MRTSNSPDNNGKSAYSAQVVLTAVALIFSVLFSAASAFWNLANPRDDIKSIETRMEARIAAVENRMEKEIGDIKQTIRDEKVDEREYTKDKIESLQAQIVELRKIISDVFVKKGS